MNAALSNATLDMNFTKQDLIRSVDKAVADKFMDIPSYKKVYLIKEEIGDASKQIVDEINKYMDIVNIRKY